MISEVLKLIPQIDQARLEQMAKTLADRFAKIAKKFGEGFKFTAKISGPLALVAGFVAKILNPLEKAEGIIERIMGTAGDTTDVAEDLETETGKLFKLQAIGRAKGVDPETLRMLLGKFQTALVGERENERQRALVGETPENKKTFLSEFTKEKDTAESFFRFMQIVRDVPKDLQIQIQNQLFGEKARGRVQAFLNTPEEEIVRIIQMLPTTPKLSKSIGAADAVSAERDILRATTEAKDFVNKAEIIGPTNKAGEINLGVAKKLDEITQARNEIDNDALRRFGPASALELEMLKTQREIEGMLTDLMTKYMPDALKFIREGKEAIEVYGKFFQEELWPGIKQTAEDFGKTITDFKDNVVKTFDGMLTKIDESVDKVTTGIGRVWDKIGGLGETINSWFSKDRGRK
jgi:hypothetical protein